MTEINAINIENENKEKEEKNMYGKYTIKDCINIYKNMKFLMPEFLSFVDEIILPTVKNPKSITEPTDYEVKLLKGEFDPKLNYRLTGYRSRSSRYTRHHRLSRNYYINNLQLKDNQDDDIGIRELLKELNTDKL